VNEEALAHWGAVAPTTIKTCNIQDDQKVSVHLMITVQKTRKNILNSFKQLP
jgi:hypothetical protein